jgi:hypothetical protein
MEREIVAEPTKKGSSVTWPGVWLGVLLATAGCSSSHEPQAAPEPVAVQQSALGGSGVSVVTRNYNYQRTGANTSETTLTTANVNSTQFGKLFSVTVDDQVYAQILFRSNLTLTNLGVTRDVFFVATVNNTVYAFDAYNGNLYWKTPLTPIGARATNNADTCKSGSNFSGNTGIVGTPAIDPATQTMFVVARTYESGSFVQRIHAIDIATGTDKYSNVISFNAGGVSFDPKNENQRPALALSNNYVYVAWGTFCDLNNARGWVAAFGEPHLVVRGSFPVVNTPTVPVNNDGECPSPGCGQGGGIWQAGGGIAVDSAGSIYAATGNGTADETSNFGYSLIKLAPVNLAVQDFFTASALVPTVDQDFGSSGPVFLPNSNLVTVGDKEGKVYVMNSTNLGHFVSGDTQIVQKFQAVQNPNNAPTSHIHGSDVTWVGPDGNTYVYVWGENDYPRSYQYMPTPNQFYATPISVGQYVPPKGMPGGMITLSSNGNLAGTGILWGTTPSNGDAAGQVVGGVLHAFNAETLALLWTSPDTWNFAKDNPPVVANGNVYVPTFSNQVNVYGITQSAPVYSGQIVDLRMRNTLFPPQCIEAQDGTTQTVQLRTNNCNSSFAQDWQFNNTSTGWEIRRPGLNLCMDLNFNQLAIYQSIQQAPCNGSQEQRFILTPVQDGMTISPAVGPTWCMALGSVEGSSLFISPCVTPAPVAYDLQVFTPVPAQLRKQNSGLPGMCVDTPNATLTAGTQLQTFNCNKQENQSWQVFTWPDGSNGIMRNGQNLCFDVPSGNAYQGQRVNQYTCNGGQSQKWIVGQGTTVNGLPFNGFNIMYDDAQILCVDVPNNSNSPNQLLRLWACNGTDAQMFGAFQPQVRKTTSGTAPGLCLDVVNGVAGLQNCLGNATQNWMLQSSGLLVSTANGCLGYQSSNVFNAGMTCTPTPPGQFAPTNLWTEDPLQGGGQLRLTNSNSTCIDTPFGWNVPVSKVQTYSCNGGASQRFTQ